MKRFFRYLLIMLLPLGVLLVRPLTPAAVLTFGREVRLTTEPFDPRDLFRGDYVELRFAVESVSKDLLSPELRKKLEENGSDAYLYVALSPDEKGIYIPVSVTETPPSEGVYLRARQLEYWGASDTVHLDYGANLSRFYVRENTGLELERAARAGKVTAVAKTWKGRIVLESLETTDE